MTELLLITVAAATVNNVVLVRLLGLCPVLGHGTPVQAVRDVSLATTGVLTITAGLSYLVDQWVLVPYGLPYLRIITYLALTLLAVQGANLALRRRNAQLPLITTNCAVLGVALLTTGSADSFAGAIALGLGTGLGFGLVLALFSTLRPRLEQAPVPTPLQGAAISLVTVGMLSLAILGFSGFGP